MVSSIVYNGDGTTRIFPVDFKILGENFVRVYVDDVEITDRRKYDIINNSIVFNEEETPQIGEDNVVIIVATSESELGDLGAPITDIMIVANNIEAINSVSQQVVPNLAEILSAISLIDFNGKYVSSATPPASPVVGTLWFDTTVSLMKVYDGTTWKLAGSSISGITEQYSYTATQGQTTFTATYDVGFVYVYVNGIRLFNTDYTATNGTSVVLNEALNAGDNVEIVAFGTFEVANTYTKGEADALLADKADVSYVDEEIANLTTAALPRPTKASPTSIMVDGVELIIASPVAGTDYYFSKTAITTTPDADTIGGFHYGLVPHGEAPTGNKTEADMVLLRGINAYSIWTKWFRPTCDPRGMFFAGGQWYDIYLMDEDYALNGHSKAGVRIAGGVEDGHGRRIPKIPLAYGGDGTVTYGKFTWFQAAEVAASAGKRLISAAEFPTVAYGVSENVSSSTGDVETVVGMVEHYPTFLSKFGMEQATGVQYIWGADIGTASGTAWASITDSRGKVYGDPNAVILGGSRESHELSGSRCSRWSNSVSSSQWLVGARFACGHMEVN